MMTYIGPQMFPHGLKPISKEEADLLVDLGAEVRAWNVWDGSPEQLDFACIWRYEKQDTWHDAIIERLYFIKVEEPE